jgi:uncharacterized protein YkwD
VVARRAIPLLAGLALLAVPSHALAINNSGDEQQLFALTNQDRTSNGLGSLASNATMFNIARGGRITQICPGNTFNGRSQDLIERNYFSHQVPPCGQYVWPALKEYGIQYTRAGENIGYNNYPEGQSVGQINTAFMNSPEHRANILGDYNQAGFGAWAAPGSWSGGGSAINGAIMYTEIFVKGPTSAPPPPPPPPPPPKPKPTQAAAPVPAPTQSIPDQRNSPAPTAAPAGGDPVAPTPNLESPSPSPEATPLEQGGTAAEVGTDRELVHQGLLENVVDQVLRLFLNV